VGQETGIGTHGEHVNAKFQKKKKKGEQYQDIGTQV
jgi:hypothetical protein